MNSKSQKFLHGKAPTFVSLVGLTLAAIFFLGGANAMAQSAGNASVQGTITDSSGAVIPKAEVTLTNTEKGTTRTTVTDSSGLYSLPNVSVGPFSLKAMASGFGSYVRTGTLEVGNNLEVNAVLPIGVSTQQVEVQSTGISVETETSNFKQVIDRQQISELPLNGRQATQLILVSGGAVSAPANDITGSKTYASSVAIAVAGSQGNYNNYVLDGGTNVDTFTNVNLPYPFPDALREFSVESNSLPARNGLHPGALVNVVTNSGTNKWHGTLFDFIRNNYLNANNFFSTTKDTLKRNQFGGTVGGKIITDRLFFFGGYQGTREHKASSASQACIPTAAELSGDFSQQGGQCPAVAITGSLVDPATGLTINTTNPSLANYRKIPTSSLSPQALALAKYLPTNLADQYGRVSITLPANNQEDQYVGRVDFTLNQKQTIFFRTFVTNFNQPSYYSPTNLLLTTTAGNDERVMNYTFGHTYIATQNLVNTFHATYARRRNNRGPSAGGINAGTIGVNVFIATPVDLRLTVNNGFAVGCGTCSPGFFNTQTEDFTDDIDYLHGKHQIAFGGEVIRTGDNVGIGFLQNGNYTFAGTLSGAKNSNVGEPLIDFLTGQMSAFGQSRQQQSTYRQTIVSPYVQDTYHATKQLTVSVGLRWEPMLFPVDKFGRGSVFNRDAFNANTHSSVYPLAPAGSFFYGDPGVPKSFTDNRLANFSPRLGVTYDPTGKGKTVFRLGGAIMYDTPGLFAIQRITSNPPGANEVELTGQISFANPYSNYAGGNPFPGTYPATSTTVFPASSLYIVIPRHIQTPTVNQWTASVQQDLGAGWNLSLNYLGNKNSHLWLGKSVNPSVYIPGTSTGANGSCGALTVGNGLPAAGVACSSTKNTANRTVLALANPTQGGFYNVQMTALDDGGNSNYNGMIATVQHRMSHNFSFLANYTLSHCISPGDAPGDITVGIYEDPANPRRDRANCGYDVRHIFNTTFVASSHFSSLHGITSALVNGWEVAPLVRMLSGFPLNVTSGVDNSLTGVALDRPNAVAGAQVYTGTKITQNATNGNRFFLNKAAFSQNTVGTFGNLGRNAFRQPNFYDVDASVSRRFPIHEELAFNLRFEVFNLMNHPNFNAFTTTLNSSTFGYATAAADPRIFQLAGKFTF